MLSRLRFDELQGPYQPGFETTIPGCLLEGSGLWKAGADWSLWVQSILVGEPSQPKKGKRALLGDLEFAWSLLLTLKNGWSLPQNQGSWTLFLGVTETPVKGVPRNGLWVLKGPVNPSGSEKMPSGRNGAAASDERRESGSPRGADQPPCAEEYV